MSEEHQKVPTNEEVIDELTKDLKNTQFECPDTEKIIEDPQKGDEDESDAESDKPRTAIVPEDSDDEELKKQDTELTPEEKEIKRQEALSLKNKGNAEFKDEKFVESIATYTEALAFCPLKYSEDRAILYANRAASRIKAGDSTNAIKDCTKAIQLNDKYVRALLRRAKLYEDTEKLDESLEDYKRILELDPGNRDALAAVHRLPPLIAERNEKLKTEMLGKLKDLGNMILRPFGLSTNNFNLQQNPSTGSYSVNFQQNPNS